MDNKSKVLIIVFALIVTASVVITFYRYIVLKDINYYVDEEAFQESLLEE